MFYLRRSLALMLGFLTAIFALSVLHELTVLLSLHAPQYGPAISQAWNSLMVSAIVGLVFLWLTVSLWTGRAWRIIGTPPEKHAASEPQITR